MLGVLKTQQAAFDHQRGVPQSDDPPVPDEPDDRLLFYAVMSAVYDASNNVDPWVRAEKLRWIAGGLVAWIGRKYHVYDQPVPEDEDEKSDPLHKYHRPHAPRDTCTDEGNHEGFEADPEIERDAISELRMGTDPSKWASEFVRLFEGDVVSWRTTPLTPTLMQAWFSAAIQAGHEAGIKVGRDVGLEEWKQHAANLERALGELRTDFIRIHAIAGQHAAYEGSKETP
jgi:hypothetical protein